MSKQRKKEYRPPRYRPEVEQLAERIVLDVEFSFQGGTLLVLGDDNPNTITLTSAAGVGQPILYNTQPIMGGPTNTNTTHIIVLGLGGMDQINLAGLNGFAGTTDLDGGDARDAITGSPSTDYIEGGKDHDVMSGGAANDTIFGEEGNDSLSGGAGNDLLHGDSELLDEALHGNDYITGGDNHDTITGGAGNDQMWGDGGNDWILGEKGNDTLQGFDGTDYLSGGDDVDLLYGGNESDTVIGGAGADEVWGGEGADRFSIGDALAEMKDYDPLDPENDRIV